MLRQAKKAISKYKPLRHYVNNWGHDEQSASSTAAVYGATERTPAVYATTERTPAAHSVTAQLNLELADGKIEPL